MAGYHPEPVAPFTADGASIEVTIHKASRIIALLNRVATLPILKGHLVKLVSF